MYQMPQTSNSKSSSVLVYWNPKQQNFLYTALHDHQYQDLFKNSNSMTHLFYNWKPYPLINLKQKKK